MCGRGWPAWSTPMIEAALLLLATVTLPYAAILGVTILRIALLSRW